MSRSTIRVRIEHDDALEFDADVLVLKHAQQLHGVDEVVYRALVAGRRRVQLPKIGQHTIVEAPEAFGATQILFLGVEPLHNFRYGEIRQFGHQAMVTLRDEQVPAAHVALTIHGPGYGLDETESFSAEVAGILEAISSGDYPDGLELISFVENNKGRAMRLEAVLEEMIPDGTIARSRGSLVGIDKPARRALRSAGYESASKQRAFVAMPFADSMEDVFHFGIQGAVNAVGMLAERADLATFTGDVMDWVRTRIAGADFVIADVTGSNANVYLEVGYAWAKGVPTILLTKKAKDLKFDVRGQRCIVYKSIKDLHEKLSRELGALGAARGDSAA